MPDDFFERIDHLSEAVGTGVITAGCLVDQPYAQDQHENERYAHFRGGRSHYLGGPLLENALSYVERIASAAITQTGSDIEDEMVKIADDMERLVFINAPKLTGDLSNSGAPYVINNGVEVFRRLPRAPRDNTPESGWNRR